LSLACCLNFSKLLFDEAVLDKAGEEAADKLDQDGTWRMGLLMPS
jgi:hypothetical protein